VDYGELCIEFGAGKTITREDTEWHRGLSGR
jgi:hypothetical protein